MDNHSYFHTEDGWIHIIVNDVDEYFIPCPHCSPSYFTYKPEYQTHELCWNANSKHCKNCCQPECELAKGTSEFTTNSEKNNESL